MEYKALNFNSLNESQFSEHLNLSTGFVIKEVKVQTLINFYDCLYQ